jgi:hypothetical protein
MDEETRLRANCLAAEIKRLSAHVSYIEKKSASQIHIDDCDFHVVLDALKARVAESKKELKDL